MPIIEYRCAGCGKVYEALQSRADDASICPACGGADVTRLLSVFSVTRPSAPPSPGPCGSDDCACRRP